MMDNPTLICQDEQRRYKVRKEGYNGLDYLEVWDDADQRTLKVFFLAKVPEGLVPANVRIKGGRRITDIRVVEIKRCPQDDPDLDDCLLVMVDKAGDFSTYELCLVALDEDGRPTDDPFPGIDPRYACLEFSFKTGCPSDLDCLDAAVCPPEPLDEPEINYLAKDYPTFRQLILDRLALVMPDWQERHVPDLGITLVELLAYTGDYLSYYQDAVATEAYLNTARQRVSVRRHARLVDYQMHEGCNARAWVCVQTDTDIELNPESISFATGYNDTLPRNARVLTWDDLRKIQPTQYELFEPLVQEGQKSLSLYKAHNCIRLYTWGDQECCLPKGATSATLIDGMAQQVPVEDEKNGKQAQTAVQQVPTKKLPSQEKWEYHRELHLKPGDVLIFEEVIGPETGNPADANPKHRHAVRLTKVEAAVDKLYRQPVLEIAWAEEDALPFPLCISAVGPPPDCDLLTNISVACGNAILVDHGRTLDPEDLGCVPTATTEVACEGLNRPTLAVKIPGRFRPRLGESPLTFSQPLPDKAPAAALLTQDPRKALPWIRLTSSRSPDCEENDPAPDPLPEPDPPPDDEAKQSTQENDTAVPPAKYPSPPPADTDPTTLLTKKWMAQLDLLGSDATDCHFVVEMDNRRIAHLRFGNNELGHQPEAEHAFEAVYRVGNGPGGNVGAEAISHMITRDLLSGVNLKPRNPMPSQGGIAPESLDEVKLFAPHAFRRELQRAITADDYAEIVMRDFGHKVQRAAAVLRWMGSWYEVMVAIDPLNEEMASQTLLDEIAGHLYRFRRIGHDLVVKPARYVPLKIEMDICVMPHYLTGHVKAALLSLFSNRRLPDGRLGFFHPDNLTFGEGIYLSKMVAVAQAVPGVESVTVTKLERLFEGDNGEVRDGVLPLGSLEVAQLDNDPGFPENGGLKFMMRGGR